MKRRTKLTVLGATVLAGAMLLSGCTASFCSANDKAHILYCFDYGVCEYYDKDHKPDGAQPIFEGYTEVFYTVGGSATGSGIGKTKTDSAKNYVTVPSNKYYEKMDQLVLKSALINK